MAAGLRQQDYLWDKIEVCRGVPAGKGRYFFMDEKKYTKEIAKVGFITILLNLILTISKVVAGILAKSTSLISDGIHSASDVLSTIVVIVGAKMASKKADKEHPFGHERMESVALVILAIMLFITAGTLMYNGVTSIISFFKGEYENQSGVFLYIALGFAIASIIVKGWMYFYTKAKAIKLKSETLRADAIHHLTDSISSIASVIGIIGLILGGNILILDPIMTIVISLFILKVSIDIFKDGINELIDKAAPEDFQENIHKDILNYPGVLAINDLKSRMFGSKIYIELEIAVLDTLSVKEGHDIAKGVHDMLEGKYDNIKHCIVHIDPYSISKEDNEK